MSADGIWRQPPPKQPLYLAGASSPCHMGPPGAIWMRGDRPEDASVLPSPGIPRALSSLCLHLSPRCGAGHNRASSWGCLFPRECQTLQKQKQHKDVIPVVLYFHIN